MKYFHLSLTFIVITTFTLIPSFAFAQEQDDSLESESALDEIIVTARKRGAEVLQEIPATISVIDEDLLRRMNVSEFEDFAYQVPGLTFKSKGPGEKRYVLRGVQSAGQQQVAVYFDEVPLPGIQQEASDSGSQTTDLKLYDLARVEVLKGPQGTVFGANSQTGTVRYISNKPKLDKLEGSVRLDLSQTDEAGDPNWGVFGMVNVPIIDDKLGVRVVAYTEYDAGYVDNVRLNLEDVNDVESWGVRGLVRWEPTDNLSFDLLAWVQNRDTDGRFGYHPLDSIFDNSLTLEEKVALSSDQGGRDTVDEFIEFQTGTFHTGDYVQTPNPDDQEIYSLTMNWELPWANLTAAGSYYARDFLEGIEASNFLPSCCGVPQRTRPDLFPAVQNETQTLDQTTFEVRLNSTHDGPYQWILGAFYRERESYFINNVPIVDPATGLPFENPPFAPGEVLPPTPGAGIEGCNPCLFARENDRVIDETAFFGELSYAITSKLEAAVGLRWYETEQSDFGFIVFPFAFGAFDPDQVPDTRLAKEDELIPKFQLSYKASDDVLVYALAAQGFRLGGTNQQGIFRVPFFYASDNLWNYEIGVKSQWLNNRVILNTAVFHIQWEDIQTAGTTPRGFGFLGNAGEAEITGFEVEIFATPNESWDFTLGTSWLPKRELTEDQVSDDIIAPGRKGDKIPTVPELTINAMAQYSRPLRIGDNSWTGWIRGEYSYRSESETEFRPFELLGGDMVNSPRQRTLHDYQILHLRTGVQSDEFDLDISLYVENVFNAQGDVFLFATPRSVTVKTTNRPRTVGIQVNKRF